MQDVFFSDAHFLLEQCIWCPQSCPETPPKPLIPSTTLPNVTKFSCVKQDSDNRILPIWSELCDDFAGNNGFQNWVISNKAWTMMSRCLQRQIGRGAGGGGICSCVNPSNLHCLNFLVSLCLKFFFFFFFLLLSFQIFSNSLTLLITCFVVRVLLRRSLGLRWWVLRRRWNISGKEDETSRMRASNEKKTSYKFFIHPSYFLILLISFIRGPILSF